jgi:serpin B
MIRPTRQAVVTILLILLASGVVAAQETIDFGSVQVGTTATSTYTFNVTEGSTGTVTVAQIAFSNGLLTSGPFELSSLPAFPATLEAGDSITFGVRFSPSTVQPYSETVALTIETQLGPTLQTTRRTITVTGSGGPSLPWLPIPPLPKPQTDSQTVSPAPERKLSSEERELVAGNTAFAFDLYQTIRGREGRLLFSPYSISSALAMAYAGARGETEEQMADILHFPPLQGDLHPAFQTLSAILASRSLDPGVTLDVANSLWLQTGYSFLDAYLELLDRCYDAHPETVDFLHAPEEACEAINEWVRQATNGMIGGILDPRATRLDTALVLVDAIYFKADWAAPFPPEGTRDRPFYLLDGREILVPTMAQTSDFGYASGEGYQAVELSYSGGTLSMVVLIPREGPETVEFGPSPPVTGPIDRDDFEAFERSLNAGRVAAILADLRSIPVRLTMPKFAYDTRYELESPLRSLGMSDAFTRDVADLSGIDGTRLLVLSRVTHAARIAVDEKGTVAAAATAISVLTTSVPTEPVPLVIDCPFVFLIRDRDTGAILFVGRVVDPRD